MNKVTKACIFCIISVIFFWVVNKNLSTPKDYSVKAEITTETALVVKKVTPTPKQLVSTQVYGKSGQGRNLSVAAIESPNPKNKILANFEIHGFEDEYKKDGQVLVNIANQLIAYFSKNPDQLNGNSLYVIASSNPDGLIEGTTNNGPGRCQISKGIDVNRDFDYYFTHNTNARNKTLTKPFGSPESAALRDLTIKIKPNYIIDMHGWLDTCYGDPTVCKYFQNALKIGFNGRINSGFHGYFAGWAMKYGKTALVELPNSKTSALDVISAYKKMLAQLD